MRRIMIEPTTQYHGRNGIYKCTGFNFMCSDLRKLVVIYPITGNAVDGRCFIQIPFECVEDFIENLRAEVSCAYVETQD